MTDYQSLFNSNSFTRDQAETLIRLFAAAAGGKAPDLASAAVLDLGATKGDFVHITGTTAITSLGTAPAGTLRLVRFAGSLVLTHHATTLILPGAANITTQANDTALLVSEGAGAWRCAFYQRASGQALVVASGGLAGLRPPPLFGSRWALLGAVSASATSFATQVANRVVYVPFFVDRALTLTTLGCPVLTANAGTADVGLYGSLASGFPGALLGSVTGLDTGTTGDKSGAVSIALTAGLYWTALRTSATPAVVTLSPAGAPPIGTSGTAMSYAAVSLIATAQASLTHPAPTTLATSPDEPAVVFARY